jgi:hypothetical protein
MAVLRRGLVLLALPLILALLLVPQGRADAQTCRVVDIAFTPGGFAATGEEPEIVPQIVAWLEKPTGEYVDTMYITNQTGRYGMANRPGRFDFNTGPNWPYGRRVTVFPVWSNRQPLKFPQLDYQNRDDSNLSHPANESTRETHFCRPLQQNEPQWDAATCSSTIYTDKGLFSSDSKRMTGYPPRSDVTPIPGMDSPSVAMFRMMNPFDAVSQASPRLGAATEVSWPIPSRVPAGDYVLFMEVALERDFNASYNTVSFPSPGQDIPFSGFGVAYRGQPSVVYRVPFTIADGETVATTDAYAGYGDPGPKAGTDGKTPEFFAPDGTLHEPDPTISTTPNSGAGRLLLTSSDGTMFRVRVIARTEPDFVAPSPPGSMVVDDTQASNTMLTFGAPGDDGTLGQVTGYDVRYRVGDVPITDAEFGSANEATYTGDIVRSGELQTIAVHNLLPETPYSFAVRAYDDCRNTSSITTVMFTTAPRKIGEVDACFVATAAYGSLLANDVELLRGFRDRLLKRTVLGELAVETYYTFGPTVAGVVGESDLLRATARDLLAPVVSWVRGLR